MALTPDIEGFSRLITALDPWLDRAVKRPKLTAADRFLTARLSAVWADWQPSSVIIKLATVIGWHRKRFGQF